MQGPGWVPVSCINCTDRGCLCVCVFASAPAVARPSPCSAHWVLCASLPTPAFPSGNDRSLLPPEPWAPVSSPFYLLAASLHHICPQVVSKVPLTVPFYIWKGHPVSPLLPGSFRVFPPLPSVTGREAQRRRYKGVFNLGPFPPGVPVPAPSHPGRGGGPRKGPPLHRCCRPRTPGSLRG